MTGSQSSNTASSTHIDALDNAENATLGRDAIGMAGKATAPSHSPMPSLLLSVRLIT